MARAITPDYLFLLRKETQGEEAPGMFWWLMYSPQPVQVVQGELLALIPPQEMTTRYDKTPPHNFRTKKNPSVTLYSIKDDVSPVYGKELQLLEAIKKPCDRFTVLTEDNKLEWGGRLKIGDQVYVRLPTSAPTWSAGVLRHVGPMHMASLPGRNFGVEITDSRHLKKGNSNGLFRRYRYFKCDRNCAVFVSLDKLAAKPPHQEPETTHLFKAKAGQHLAVPEDREEFANPQDKKHTANINSAELDQIRAALNEDIDLSKQKELLDAFNKDSKKKAQQNESKINVQQPSGQARGHLIKKQHSWHPGSDHTLYGERKESPQRSATKIPVEHERALPIHAHSIQRGPRSYARTYSQPLTNQDYNASVENSNPYNQMAPQNTGEPDYVNRDTVDQDSRSQQNQPLRLNQWQSNPVYPQQPGAEHYQKTDQEIPSGPEYPNIQHPGVKKRQSHHDAPPQVPQDNALVRSSNPYNLAVDSTVQVASANPNDPQHYEVIKGTGTVDGVDGQVTGIEVVGISLFCLIISSQEDYMEWCTDGTFKATGEKHFTCNFERGMHFPQASLCPHQRVGPVSTPQAEHAASSHRDQNPIQVPMEEQLDRFIDDPTEQMMRYIGNSRGIQGHQNSCYLDSTLFGLFALSDIFDTVFLAPDQSIITDQNRKRVVNLLWKGIVNPLRKNGVVRFESVMKMRNALDELGKMEGITEKKKDPEEFLNTLFKHVQRISFTKVPSKLLIQVSRFGREIPTYKKIVPELKLNIRELTDTYKKAPPCLSCGEESAIKCEICGFLSQQQFTHYCQRCSDLFHNPSYKDKVQHRLTAVVVTATPGDDPGLAELDLLSVICIETSHYVCFTRDPRDKNPKKWIFLDSMADRQFDTYNIPRVTDCTRELNEWVYEGDQDRLINTPPRKLPELVRRFTQDIYMCVYVQPDIAMYGDGDEASTSVKELTAVSVVPTMSEESKDDIVEELKQEITSLQVENRNLQQRIETNQAEQSQHIQLLEAEKQQLLQRYNERERTTSQEMAEKEEQIQHHKMEKQQSDNEKLELERRKKYHKAQSKRYQQQAQDMQRRLEVAESKTSQSKFSKLQIPRLDQDSWNVRRHEVVLQDKLGHGAWGSVCRGLFCGQQVAVKCAHTKILHKNTIDQLKREIRIMAHVQHPNLVRLIAAVVDAGVERGTDSPLLVLEFLDTDLRSAYETKIVNFQKDALLSIFREVAYALHYLHEYQEPIIHRDVSAPNVLLQQIHPGVWKAKLSDFGSANLVKHSKTPAPGAIIYSAPETFPSRVVQKQTTKIDVYSYGYLLVEAIAKEMPSDDEKETLLLKIKTEWVDMYNVITACTAYEQEDRLTMTQVLEKLNKLPSH
ncbi:ubiquitin carboxyl-terminal hydrolase CYLD-like isoform X3 [Halichondria panicea]|uniref:ubiquitin carboxyl-terminal hydrolase CYLD-like isoform X3 n=1 Tax=Halichondria panicea TaxID=6063 RepID=UPI00312B3A77